MVDDRFRTAVALGIVSIPFTVGINWMLTPDIAEATPYLIVCLLSGYLYGPRSISVTRAGIITGSIGGIPIVVWNSRTALTNSWGNPIVTDAVGDSVMMAAVSVGATLFTAAVLTVVVLAIGWVGGIVGGWMRNRVDSRELSGSRT